MVSGQHLLVVDGLAETKEVLKAVFEPRGLNVDRIRGHDDRRRDSRANLVVLHEDASQIEVNRWQHLPRVVIGSARLTVPNSGECRLREPFQYPELIQAIESLLDQS
ncbi:MAG: hypothetical protein O3A00_01250 [Planctomycetota bacterium]|nr:hypothetical protein [Planctomycetota bacterium]